jgi:16S rRNA (guanine527-N7)-methyltransferase
VTSPDPRALQALLRRYGAPAAATAPLGVLLKLLATPDAPTSVHDPRRVLDVHVADSLAGLEVGEIRAARLIVDVGAGAGLPGLVLAAVLPETNVALVEAASCKCAFLRSAAAAMRLGNVEIVCARVEEWRAGVGNCDVVCARALASLSVICEYAAPLLRPEGVLVAWKGAVPASEAADAQAAAAHLGLAVESVRAVVPFAGSERRTLHILRKVAPTPASYPRRPGMATKRPLTAKNLR